MLMLRFVLIGALFQYGAIAHGDQAANLRTLKVQQQGMAEFEKVIAHVKTVGDFLDIMKDHAAPEDREFLASKLKGQDGQAGLKILRRIDNGVVLGRGAAAIPITFIPNEMGMFLINNKRVDLSAGKTPQERWQAIESALPKISRLDHKMTLMESQASAQGYFTLARVAGQTAIAAATYAAGVISTGASICDTITQAWDFCSAAETKFSDYLKRKYGGAHVEKNAKKEKKHCHNPENVTINFFDDEFKETGAAAAYAAKMYTDKMDLWKKAVGNLWCSGSPAGGFAECIDLIAAKKKCYSIDQTRWRALGVEAQGKFPDAPMLLLSNQAPKPATEGTGQRAVPKDVPQ